MIGASFDSLHHAFANDDAACGVLPTIHDASAHRIGGGSAAPQSEPDHCFICHWARAFRLAPGSVARGAVRQVLVVVVVAHAAVRLAAAPDLSHLPARSPPWAA
jgi:hypothetical protein